MSDPADYDITIHCGATFKLEVAWADSASTPIVIAPLQARMQIRQRRTSTTTMASLSSATGEILLDSPTAGIIKIRIPATVTETILKDGVYDLELFSTTDTTEVDRLLQGRVTVSREVTQP